jgi:hypothetical protein
MNTTLTLALSILALTSSSTRESERLPLRRGHYVDVNSGCFTAASAAKTWFGGGYVIQAPHASCELKTVKRLGLHDYTVSMRCYENGDRAMPFARNDHVKIVSHTEYELENAFGKFRSRWCPR